MQAISKAGAVRLGAQVATLLVLAPAAAEAQHEDGTTALLCGLLMAQERSLREDLDLELAQRRSDLEWSTRILAMMDALAEADAVERLRHLRAQRYDFLSRIDLERAGLRARRKDAVLESYGSLCRGKPRKPTPPEDRQAAEEALLRWRQLDCDLVEKSVERGRGNLRFSEEVHENLEIMHRANAVAELTVIEAVRDVVLARDRVEVGRARLAACRAELASERTR